MRIAVHDSDKTKFPNLALMKLSAFHKRLGDTVEWFSPFERDYYDIVYSSRIFTWSKTDPYLPEDAIVGGTGVGNFPVLPQEAEALCPDYDLYGQDFSIGFLTRGCIRNCKWCFVPSKEGKLRPHHSIERFAKHKNVVLMDNNFLASGDYAIEQIDKMVEMGLKVDFNQGLDARLIDDAMAKQLARLKWSKSLRLACDSRDMIPHIDKAVKALRKANCTPKRYFVYTLVEDVDDAWERVLFLDGIGVDPFAQPYRDKKGTPPSYNQKRFARWVNRKAIFRSTKWSDYK